MTDNAYAFAQVLEEARACTVCAPYLPLGPRPVVRLQASNRILITSQAPGTKVHATGLPFTDVSGDRLREWLGTDLDTFYGPHIGFMPMGFCYPGKGKSGDNPPRPECAPIWHHRLRGFLPHVQLTLLVGSYAHAGYLPHQRHLTLAQRCLAWLEEQGPIIPMVHPSPRNRLWLKLNPWYEETYIPLVRSRVQAVLSEHTRVQII
ncbi:MAG: uracil-DNA glycosylase family protein [Alphaproteobacteria bacterium]|nr:MAG: uracil-DNA glycosylase family protein [Alphaproteobacteria bacterium]